MNKTIIECMYALTEKMRDPEIAPSAIKITPDTTKRASSELRHLRQVLGMSTMQVLILTAIVQKSARYRIDADDIAFFLGMEYLQFLTHDSDLMFLKQKGYIRVDKEYHITVPKDVLKALKGNKPVEPEPTTGLSTGQILSRMKKLFSIRKDDQMDAEDLFDEIALLIKDNPETSIAKACEKHIKGICTEECVFFFALIWRYWFEEDDMVGWHDVDDYFDEIELDCLRTDSKTERLGIQRRKLIEFTGYEGMMTKDYFRIKDEIKDEILADLGGIRKVTPKISASRKLEASAIGKKEMFYNMDEGHQVSQLKELMSEVRFNEIRTKMKDNGLRTGFTCLFYGSPGTGKTETVYQIARECHRDLFIVDVSQIKSCWVGDSEKNIKDVFDKYKATVKLNETTPILLFNEADAIFGIRQEGAHSAVDKMENSIQNIILQEMEELDGILIATTNLTTNLDKAFERRFLYKIRFEKPTLEARVSIWRLMLPELSEGEAVQLATDFNFSGGQIENIARKRAIKSIIDVKEPGYAEIREFCREENIGNSPKRKIGF